MADGIPKATGLEWLSKHPTSWGIAWEKEVIVMGARKLMRRARNLSKKWTSADWNFKKLRRLTSDSTEIWRQFRSLIRVSKLIMTTCNWKSLKSRSLSKGSHASTSIWMNYIQGRCDSRLSIVAVWSSGYDTCFGCRWSRVQIPARPYVLLLLFFSLFLAIYS